MSGAGCRVGLGFRLRVGQGRQMAISLQTALLMKVSSGKLGVLIFDLGVSENGVAYVGVLIIRILLFRVQYFRVPYFWKLPFRDCLIFHQS